MRKLYLVLLGLFFAFTVSIFASHSVFAHHKQDVLGDTDNRDLSIPQTAEGPGLILPDSPFYFLDNIKQNFRLMIAFTSEQKAKVHSEIAGERLAELQLMLSKNNEEGVRVALQGVSDNLGKAADDISEAKLKGKDVSELAQKINESIKEKQNSLSVLEEKAGGEIKYRVQAARHALKAAKVNVEDHLPETVLKREMEEDLRQKIKDHINSAEDSADGINHSIDVLHGLIENADKEDQARRRKALQEIAEEKNAELRKKKEAMLEKENHKRERLMEAKKKSFEEAKEAAKKIEESIAEYNKTEEEIDEIENTDVEEFDEEKEEDYSEEYYEGSDDNIEYSASGDETN